MHHADVFLNGEDADDAPETGTEAYKKKSACGSTGRYYLEADTEAALCALTGQENFDALSDELLQDQVQTILTKKAELLANIDASRGTYAHRGLQGKLKEEGDMELKFPPEAKDSPEIQEKVEAFNKRGISHAKWLVANEILRLRWIPYFSSVGCTGWLTDWSNAPAVQNPDEWIKA